MRVVLIHEENESQVGLLVTVNAGSQYDPNDKLGLANLTLKSMMKRSSKYPELNSFKTFCDSKGIWSEAYNKPQIVSFNSQFEQKDRDEFLDRFVSCFEFPMFLDSDIDIEVQKLVSSSVSSSENEWDQTSALISEESDPKSLLHKWDSGVPSHLTKQGIHDEVRKYFNTHYAAANL